VNGRGGRERGVMEIGVDAENLDRSPELFFGCQRSEIAGFRKAIEHFGRLADIVASHLAIAIADRQAILETLSVASRLEKLLGLMQNG